MEAGGDYQRRMTRPVPAWEKRFCLVVGRMRWRDFLSRKEHVACGVSRRVDEVLRWDDSAGYECFRDAKARFYSDRCGVPRRAPLGPDLYVDEVVWREPGDDDDWELRWLAAEAEEAQERAMELAAARSDCVDWRTIPLEEIKATGWDDDVVDYSSRQNPNLTGMVVGGDGVDGSAGRRRCTERKKNRCNVKRSANADVVAL